MVSYGELTLIIIAMFALLGAINLTVGLPRRRSKH